jgi:hypothetical protein
MIRVLVLVLVVVAALVGGRVWGFYDGVYYSQCDQVTQTNPPDDLNTPDPPECTDDRPAIVVRATDWLDDKVGLDRPGSPPCLRDGTCGD